MITGECLFVWFDVSETILYTVELQNPDTNGAGESVSEMYIILISEFEMHV